MTQVAVIDYGVNNLASVMHAFSHLGIPAHAAKEPAQLEGASHVVLPGVGSFPAGMASLRRSGFADVLPQVVGSGLSLLGLCLGMQLLADGSDEFGDSQGLGLLPGRVGRLRSPDLPLPHMGWNKTVPTRACSLFDGLEDEAAFYFVHSYGFLDPEAEMVVAVCEYGKPVVAAVNQGNIYGVQFHPEKSQKSGLKLLRNFVTLC